MKNKAILFHCFTEIVPKYFCTETYTESLRSYISPIYSRSEKRESYQTFKKYCDP